MQPECNIPACNYDNSDCKYQSQPWKHCSEPQEGILCWKVFNDTKCDPQCDTKECLFDGFDCSRDSGQCNPHYDNYCRTHYNDGKCDPGCNSAECNWDGHDCEREEDKRLALGTLVIVVGVTPETFYNMSKEFLRKLGNLLRAVLVIKTDKNGNDMVYPYIEDKENKRNRRSVPSNSAFTTTPGPEADG